MRSFSSLSVLFTVALGALTSAAPFNPSQAVPGALANAVPNVGRELLTTVPHLDELTKSAVAAAHVEHTRDGAPQSVAVVFNSAMIELRPLIAQLQYVNAQNATVAALTPVVTNIKASLGQVVTQVGLLKGQSSHIILRGVDGVVDLTVAELAKFIWIDLSMLILAIGQVLAVVAIDVKVDVTILLVEICVDVARLLVGVGLLVDGVIFAISALVDAAIRDIVIALNVPVLRTVLRILA